MTSYCRNNIEMMAPYNASTVFCVQISSSNNHEGSFWNSNRRLVNNIGTNYKIAYNIRVFILKFDHMLPVYERYRREKEF